jgi:hypothetical protein
MLGQSFEGNYLGMEISVVFEFGLFYIELINGE